MTIFDRIRLMSLYVRLVRNPKRTDLIFRAIQIVTKYKDNPVGKSLRAHIERQEGFQDRFSEGYLPRWPSLSELRQMPEGSFGAALARHMVENDLDFDLFPRLEKTRDSIAYLNARAYQDHDLWHALLGYGTEIEDELALQAFNVAQFKSPISGLILSGGLLHMVIFSPLKLSLALKRIAEGYRLGEETRFLLGLRLMDWLERPLAEVQSEVRRSALRLEDSEAI